MILVKVKMLRPLWENADYFAGKVYEVPLAQAHRWIKDGFAEYAEPQPVFTPDLPEPQVFPLEPVMEDEVPAVAVEPEAEEPHEPTPPLKAHRRKSTKEGEA